MICFLPHLDLTDLLQDQRVSAEKTRKKLEIKMQERKFCFMTSIDLRKIENFTMDAVIRSFGNIESHLTD